MADVVKYIGLSGVRRIRKQAWEAAGVKGQDTVVWNKGNRYSVPVEELTDDALELLSKDKTFVLPKSEQDTETTDAADSDVLPTGEKTPSGATTTATSNQPSSTRGSRSGGKGGPSS